MPPLGRHLIVWMSDDATETIPVKARYKAPTPEELLEEFIQIPARDGSTVVLRTRLVNRMHLKPAPT